VGISLYDINGPGVYIDDGDDTVFQNQARYCLNVLYSKPLGVDLLKDIRAACTNGKTVVIEKSTMANAIPTTDTSVPFRASLNQPGNGILVDHAYALVVKGKAGCSAICRWAFNDTIPGTTIKRPAFISMVHELIHCLHYLTANCARPPTRQFDLTMDSGLCEEEARTVGLGPYSSPAQSEKYCENAFRLVFGVARRDFYQTGVDLSAAKRTAGF
jgi:hypothetical protein